MNKVYLVVPLMLVVVFGGVYWRFRRGYDARVAADADTARVAAEVREQQQIAAQLAAQKAAAAALARRTEERLAREREEEAQRVAIAEAEQRRSDAAARAGALKAELIRLRADLAEESVEVSRLERKKTALLEQHEVLAVAIHQAEFGRRAFRDLIEKLEIVTPTGATLVGLEARHPSPASGRSPQKLP